MPKFSSIFLAALLLSACAAHSPFILKNTTDSSALGAAQFPPYDGKVFVTKGALPENVKYTPIAKVDIGKVWYGSSDNVLVSLADRARELGGNAIINVKTWHQPSGFSWSAPHGSGEVVRIENMKKLDAVQELGGWY